MGLDNRSTLNEIADDIHEIKLNTQKPPESNPGCGCGWLVPVIIVLGIVVYIIELIYVST